MVEQLSPSLIVMDVRMGEHDGKDLCRQLKENSKYQHLPVILLSRTAHLGDNDCKADDFIEKPFEIEHFLSSVKRLLKKTG